MEITLGGIAAIIAAIAFALLVIYLCITLSRIAKVLTEAKTTVDHVNKTLGVVTKDVDNLLIEVEGLLNKANTLVDDVNGKVSKTDPLFTAIGDLGITVSDLNDSTRQMTVNFVNGMTKKKTSTFDKIVKSSMNRFKSSKVKQQASGIETEDALVSELEAYRPETPSATAGEININ